jgi:hypothetical protein
MRVLKLDTFVGEGLSIFSLLVAALLHCREAKVITIVIGGFLRLKLVPAIF